LRLFSFANQEITMLQCYVLTCGWSVTAFWRLLEVSARGKGPVRSTQRPALVTGYCHMWVSFTVMYLEGSVIAYSVY
jgi:hypothetical protein